MTGYAVWAPQYRDRLWTGVLPLRARTKSPVPKGWTGRGGQTPSDDQIEAWRARFKSGNIALRMPGDVLGIDVDDYPYSFLDDDGQLVEGRKHGGTVLAGLEAELGPLPPTWRSSSRGDGPSGIRFYRVPPGLLWGDFGEHLEGIWWGHRYAVVYPSVNPDSGREYQWINDAAERPAWGAPPPKVTDFPDLPESWVARFGRAADAPARMVQGAPTAPRRPSPVAGHRGPRKFTRQQAADFVQPFLDALRAAPVGSINNLLNDAAKVLSHFVPAFWSPMQASVLLHDALAATAYDGRTWKADETIRSAMDSGAADWEAVLIPDRPARPAARPAPAAEDDEPKGGDIPPPDDGMDDAVASFWERRPFLRYVDTYARSRYCAPWAVLGSVLALAASSVEPNIQLPAIIGSEASLNLFVGLVGPSGGGKDIAFGVAKRMLDVRCGAEQVLTDVIPLGSGEGLSHIYMKHPPKPTRRRRDDEDSELIGLAAGQGSDAPIQYRTRALVTIKEIDTLDAIGQRKGSTLGGQLRQGWSGDQIGFHYVDTAKRMIVPEHSYRLCIVAGIQPGRAQSLLSSAESDGGTPQRFLWLPATDPTMSMDAPATPLPVEWMPPVYQGRVVFDVCPEASEVILEAHVKRNRGDGDALDGHALLTRLKVAAALAMLDSRDARMQCTVTAEDWELAGIVMAVSDRTRAAVQRHLADAARLQNEKTAVAKAHEAIVMTETVENAAVRKAQRWVLGRLSGQEWAKNADLRKDAGRNKPTLAEALDGLVASGRVEVRTFEYRGNTGYEYRLAGGDGE